MEEQNTNQNLNTDTDISEETSASTEKLLNDDGINNDDSNYPPNKDFENQKILKKKLLSAIELFEVFVFSIFVVLLVFSFAFRICVVDGTSMNNTLQNGEKLLTRDLFYSPECGDIVVFYENEPLNKPLVKRVIATEGQTIEINYLDGTVKVDGVLLDEEYVYLSGNHYILYPKYVYDTETRIFKATVPDGMLFVMGDNRNDSWDSRSYDIGFISEEQIMGKVIIRLSPFATFN